VTTPAIFVRFRPSCGPTYLLTYCLTLTCAQDQSSEVDPRDAPGGRSELLSIYLRSCVWTTPKMLVVVAQSCCLLALVCVDDAKDAGGRSERRRAVDDSCSLPAHLCHVVSHLCHPRSRSPVSRGRRATTSIASCASARGRSAPTSCDSRLPTDRPRSRPDLRLPPPTWPPPTSTCAAPTGSSRRRRWPRTRSSTVAVEMAQGTMPGARRRGRPRTAWVDNTKTWKGLPVEESVRTTEDRDKWRKCVHGVACRSRTAEEQN